MDILLVVFLPRTRLIKKTQQTLRPSGSKKLVNVTSQSGEIRDFFKLTHGYLTNKLFEGQDNYGGRAL